MTMRMLLRFGILGLAAYGAKRLYDTFFGSTGEARQARSAIADRVGRASERVKGEGYDAVHDVATHARAASQEIRDTASDVVDLTQTVEAGDGRSQPRPA